MSTNLKYPYNWGRTIVQEFVEQYARGTYFLAKMCGLSAGDLRMRMTLVLCSGNSVKWESLKRMVLLMSDWDNSDYAKFSPNERRLVLKYYRYLAEDDVLDEKSVSGAIDNVSQRRLF